MCIQMARGSSEQADPKQEVGMGLRFCVSGKIPSLAWMAITWKLVRPAQGLHTNQKLHFNEAQVS